SVTLIANLNNLYLAHDNASYQWKYETSSGIWTNVINPSNSTTLTISNLNSLDSKTYILVVTIDNLTLYSNSITINPVVSNQASITITSSNKSAVGNTLNIYNSNNATLSLTLNLNNLDLSSLKDVNITWFVNGKEEQTNSNETSFEYTYSLGNNKVSVNISYSLDGKTKTISTTSYFNINYYDLNITATNPSISYGTNANTDSITINSTKTYLYKNASYQWEVNGKLVGSTSNTKPTTLPSYIIQQTTTFNLVVTNDNDPSATPIVSNSITITPSKTSFTASLSNVYGSNDTLDVYSNVTGTTPSSYTFNAKLEQNKEQYSGSLNNATTTWTLTFNNKTINTIQTSTLSFDLPISDLTQSGTYTLVSSTKLVGISAPITASYTINYSQLTISSNTGYDGTLTLNNTNFGSIITHPYYFWEVEGSDDSWSTVSPNNNSSPSYDVSNLTSSETYRVIVANNATLKDATITIISDSCILNAITTSVNVSNATNKDNIYEANYNSKVTLTSNINIKNSSNVTYQWYCNSEPIANATSSSYSFTQGSSSNSYYVVLYINNVKQTQSQTITVNPSYDASKFSLAIYENNNIANTTINDLQNISSYDLSIKLLYDGSIFDTQPSSNIIWTLNDNQNQSTSNTFTPTLVIGKNTIDVTVNDLSSTYGIKGDTLSTTLT
ncbi:MAG: hypothetical protein IIT97_01095, partial [Mycoplasmataceae bacterium]|nr:hypothetical protein [Mycoplasmataceae bacterium]